MLFRSIDGIGVKATVSLFSMTSTFFSGSKFSSSMLASARLLIYDSDLCSSCNFTSLRDEARLSWACSFAFLWLSSVMIRAFNSWFGCTPRSWFCFLWASWSNFSTCFCCFMCACYCCCFKSCSSSLFFSSSFYSSSYLVSHSLYFLCSLQCSLFSIVMRNTGCEACGLSILTALAPPDPSIPLMNGVSSSSFCILEVLIDPQPYMTCERIYLIWDSLLKCVFSCAVKLLDYVNLLWQPGYLHTYGFSPVWVLRWVLRLKSSENLLLQRAHLNGFSPVWTSWCLFSFELSRNRLPQPATGQIYYRSPWVIKCFLRDDESVKILPQPRTWQG